MFAVRALHPARAAWLIALLALSACVDRDSDDAPPERTPAPTVTQATTCVVGGETCDTEAAPEPAPLCELPIPVYRDGTQDGGVCPQQLEDEELTVVELGADWVPLVLRGDPTVGAIEYAKRYAAIASETIGDDESWHRENHDRFFELFGIFPAFEIVAARLADEERHRCHEAVDDTALEGLVAPVDTWRPLMDQRSDAYRITSLERQLANVAELAGVEDATSLGKPYDDWGTLRDKLVNRREAVTAMQEHLRCEGLLGGDGGEEGLLDGDTIEAMFAYHRRHMLVTWQLDEATADVLVSDSRELDFLTLLRSLRERIVDASGLIEDGTASGDRAEVVDRTIDTPVFQQTHREHGAPDLIGRATDRAARALGWTDPAAALRSLKGGLPSRVALSLGSVPDYHRDHMELSVEIDRGDVWFDFPYVHNGDRRLQPREQRPTTTLFVEHEGEKRALSSWPTTIGGWQPEKVHGRPRLVYKESPAGERIWRDVVAAPRWFPPRSTPDRDLLRPLGHGRFAPRHDTFGPSYASAYGLVMMIHHRVDTPEHGEPFLTDQGIRSHGSVSYDSILDDYSHGCHRLHNHRAVRLGGFLLAHRRHVIHGNMPDGYDRRIHYRRKAYDLHFETRGYRYELTPPVDVEVLEGRTRGHAQSPRPSQRLTRPMSKRYRFH